MPFIVSSLYAVEMGVGYDIGFDAIEIAWPQGPLTASDGFELNEAQRNLKGEPWTPDTSGFTRVALRSRVAEAVPHMTVTVAPIKLFELRYVDGPP